MRSAAANVCIKQTKKTKQIEEEISFFQLTFSKIKFLAVSR